MPTSSERILKLQEMLAKQPNDAFLLYGIALEHKKANDPAKAIEFLDRTIVVDPGYCYAYFQKGQVQELQGDTEAAKRTYHEGIEAAKKKGDEHARQEIEGALQMIE